MKLFGHAVAPQHRIEIKKIVGGNPFVEAQFAGRQGIIGENGASVAVSGVLIAVRAVEMPLAKMTCRVAGGLEDLRDSQLLRADRRARFGETGQVLIKNLRVELGKYIFDYHGLYQEIKDIIMNMPGRHNVENACVAVTVALINGVTHQNIKKALAGFKGIQRRFERIIDSKDLVFIDDYAHHPGELRVAIDAARTLYPDRKITGIFQPRLYSRTRDFVDGFAEELDKLDEIILMDIYPARELPIEGVTSEIIFNKMKNQNKILVTKESLMHVLKDYHPEVPHRIGSSVCRTEP